MLKFHKEGAGGRATTISFCGPARNYGNIRGEALSGGQRAREPSIVSEPDRHPLQLSYTSKRVLALLTRSSW